MKKSMFGGYDRQEMDTVLEGLQEKTNQANVKAAQLQNALEESQRQMREDAAQAAETLRGKERELADLEFRMQQLLGENETLRAEKRQLERSVEEYEHKIAKVGQIYITAYDEADKITADARDFTHTAVNRFAETVTDANTAMQKQLGYLIMAKESMKETMASVSSVMQKSFEVFTERSLEIDRAILDVDAYTKEVRDQIDGVFEKQPPDAAGSTQEDPEDLIQMFQNQVPQPGTI